MCASASCTVHRSRAAGRKTGHFQSAGVSRETTWSRRASWRFVRSTTSLRVCRMVRGASYRMATVTRYRGVVHGSTNTSSSTKRPEASGASALDGGLELGGLRDLLAGAAVRFHQLRVV